MGEDFIYESTQKMVALCERNNITCSLLARSQRGEILLLQGDFLLPYSKEIICDGRGCGYGLLITLPMSHRPDDEILVNLSFSHIRAYIKETSYNTEVMITGSEIEIGQIIEIPTCDINNIDIRRIIRDLEFRITNLAQDLRRLGVEI